MSRTGSIVISLLFWNASKNNLKRWNAGAWEVFNDLDHDLEWCEEQILQTFEELGFADKRKVTSPQLDVLLPYISGKNFLESLVEDRCVRTNHKCARVVIPLLRISRS